MTGGTRVSAVVLAYGAEPQLADCVHALLASSDAVVDVVLVDNGCTSDDIPALAALPGVTLVSPGHNTGFAGGCNLGAGRAEAAVLAFVNGDAIVAPEAMAALAQALDDDTVGIASASLRLHDRPPLLNSAGNPVHYLGLSWAGALGEDAAAHAEPVDIASATGAAMACRRTTWDRLGGFCELMFAYCEDTELSLRTWQLGLHVRYVPGAVVTHRYEFSRNPLKFYLLERNRLLLLLTLYERRTLAAVAVPLVGLELAMLAVAIKQGWWRQKVRGWWWLFRHRADVRRRRELVQAARVVPDRDLLDLLTARFTPGAESGITAPAPVSTLAVAWWRLVRLGLAR